jgi:hypothetical protein
MKLIKQLLIVFLITLNVNLAQAQGWGVRAGAAFSNVSLREADIKIGAYAGLYKQIGVVSKLLYVQPEIQFSKQGFTTKTDDFDLNYVQVPILARLYFLKIISIETGPQFGFLVSDKTDGPTKANFKTFDSSWATGLTFNLPLGFSIDTRYIASFTDLSTLSGAKNQVFQLGAGFKF